MPGYTTPSKDFAPLIISPPTRTGNYQYRRKIDTLWTKNSNCCWTRKSSHLCRASSQLLFLSLIFMIPKKSEEQRLIINLKQVSDKATFQDGRCPPIERLVNCEWLDDKSGPQGGILCSSHSTAVSEFPMELKEIPVHLFSIRPFVCSKNLHKNCWNLW